MLPVETVAGMTDALLPASHTASRPLPWLLTHWHCARAKKCALPTQTTGLQVIQVAVLIANQVTETNLVPKS